MFYGVGALLVLALWIYCIVDCISTDDTLVRNLPKMAWLFLVIILPTVGSVAWLVLGRPTSAGFYPNQARRVAGPPLSGPARPSMPPELGPEDSPEFLASLEERRLRVWERDLRKREEELRRREGEDPPDPVG